MYALWIDEVRNSFVLQASTGLVIKIKQADMMVLTTLSVLQNPDQCAKPIKLCSFGNIDLLKTFKHVLNELKNEGLTRKRVKAQILDDFQRCCVNLRVCSEALQARKEWLLSNSRCSEILDSEFYYQALPSLDMCLFNIDN